MAPYWTVRYMLVQHTSADLVVVYMSGLGKCAGPL